jgi:hypothetical protein
MGIDFDKVLGKLKREEERKASEEDRRLEEMERQDRRLERCLADLSRDMTPPEISVGTRLYKPVYSSLHRKFSSVYGIRGSSARDAKDRLVDELCNSVFGEFLRSIAQGSVEEQIDRLSRPGDSIPEHVVDRISETMSVISMDRAWSKTDKGTWMCRVAQARDVPFSQYGGVVGPAWCVSPGVSGIVCFLVDKELPPDGWTWLEVTKVTKRMGDDRRERITIFAKAVTGVREDHLAPFGFGQLIEKALKDLEIPFPEALPAEKI